MITIFSKETCPYCDMAKWLLTSLWIEYTEVDVTSDMDKLREIVAISWMMSVPQIFNWEIVKENLIGWYDELKKLNDEGELVK